MKQLFYTLLLLFFSISATAQSSTSYAAGSTINILQNGQNIHWSGRAYLDLNTWRGFNNTYGYSYWQFSQGFGTGATPNIPFTANGFIVNQTGTCLELNLNGRINNAEVSIYDVEIICIRTLDNTNTTTTVWSHNFQFKSNSTNTRIFNIPINQPVQKGDEIIFAMRKNTGTTTRRYFYFNANLLLQ